MPITAELKTEILALVRQYQGGDSAGLAALVESLLTAEPPHVAHAERFEHKLARLFGVREALLVASGSAANQLAVSSLTSARMGKLRLKPKDEVITIAAGSASLVKALTQNQLAPVFVDITVPGFNVDVRKLQGALSRRTRAIALPHLFGNPFDLDSVTMFAAFHNLLLIEDCRAATGARFAGRPVGCFGQFATASFHAGRHLAAGTGGAVLMNSPVHRGIAESLAERHREAEMVAAVGSVQIELLAQRMETRSRNAHALLGGLAEWREYLMLPESLAAATPSWLELPVVVREHVRVGRDALVKALREAGLEARALPATGSLTETKKAGERGLLLTVPAVGGVDAAVDALHASMRRLLG